LTPSPPLEKIMNIDIFIQILKYTTNPTDICKFTRINKYYYSFCKANRTSIKKAALKTNKVEYKDPHNLIYSYNNIDIDDYRSNKGWDIDGIFSLYYTLNMQINVENNQDYQTILVTSIPILHNLETCKLNYQHIIYFPKQPKMITCKLVGNEIKHFPTQPQMITCHLHGNKLTFFDTQPKMVECKLNCNKLTHFYTQPKMEFFSARENKLKTLDIQPEMTRCDISNNNLTHFSTQPKMTECFVDFNELTVFNSQPEMTKCNLDVNKLECIEIQPKMEENWHSKVLNKGRDSDVSDVSVTTSGGLGIVGNLYMGGTETILGTLGD
jgi:hypothetical protein